MSWFRREKKEVGEYRKLSELPPLPDNFGESSRESFDEKELPPLPSFPSSVAGERMSREIVKQAVKPTYEEIDYMESDEEGEAEYTSLLPPPGRSVERSIEVPAIITKSKEMKTEPVFVRIDKYQEALINFQDIKKRILETEDLLKEINEIKTKEEKELQEWEEEIKSAKEKLDKIDESLFGKL